MASCWSPPCSPVGVCFVRNHSRAFGTRGPGPSTLTPDTPTGPSPLPIGETVVVADEHDVRRIALALPHVEEIPSEGFDFRFGNKGFVWSYPERVPGERRHIRTDIAVLFVGDESERQALLLGEPDLFFSASGYEDWPLVLLRLDAVDVKRLEELIVDAWHMRAPDDIRAELR